MISSADDRHLSHTSCHFARGMSSSTCIQSHGRKVASPRISLYGAFEEGDKVWMGDLLRARVHPDTFLERGKICLGATADCCSRALPRLPWECLYRGVDVWIDAKVEAEGRIVGLSFPRRPSTPCREGSPAIILFGEVPQRFYERVTGPEETTLAPSRRQPPKRTHAAAIRIKRTRESIGEHIVRDER